MQVKSRKSLERSIMLGAFGFSIMTFMLPVYGKMIGGSAFAIGGLFSMFSIVTLVLRPIIGMAIDKYGRKYFFVASFIFYSLSMLIFSNASSVGHLYISRFIQAIGSSLMWISAYSIATDISEDTKMGNALGSIDGASSKGSLYGSIIAFSLFSICTFDMGIKFLFKGYAVLALIAAYIAFKGISETRVKTINTDRKLKKKYSRNFYMLMIIVFATAFSASMLNPLLMVYLQDKFTNDIGVIAMAFIPAALIYAYLPAKFGSMSDKYGRIPLMVIGLICSGIVSICLGNVISINMLIFLWSIEAIGGVMSSPAEEALVAELSEDESRGSGYGIYMFVGSLGAIVGPLLGGWVYDNFSHSMPFYINGGILLLNAILALFIFRGYSKKIYKDETINEEL